MAAQEAVGRWLRHVVADAELSPYLIGVDLERLGAHLAADLAAAVESQLAADPWRVWPVGGAAPARRRQGRRRLLVHAGGPEPAERGDALTIALGHHRPDHDVYVCGPPPMLAGARLRLLAAGVPADRIHLPAEMAP
ncbi:hypothetical protein ACFHW0_14590 [Micromonospora sp. LOL_025]|uniref:hypothetical protein n=1 Tax=Micromonospora sp. LOL_025 TaxID=3345413 RepID=UPI003A84BCFC